MKQGQETNHYIHHMDHGDHGGPWWSWELWRPWRSWELRWPWQGWELRWPWQMVFGGLGLGPLGPAPTAGTLTTPPQNFPGEVRGYQEPSGAKQTRQYKTRQERPPGPDRQDRTAHRNQKPSWAGLEAEASSGHDEESGALTGSLSKPLPSQRQGGRRLEWPPWPQQEEPPAPDESPRTRQG